MRKVIIHAGHTLKSSLPAAIHTAQQQPGNLVELRLDTLAHPIGTSQGDIQTLQLLHAKRLLERYVLLSHRGGIAELTQSYSALLSLFANSVPPPFAIVDLPLPLFTTTPLQTSAETFRTLARETLISVHQKAEDSLTPLLHLLEPLRSIPAHYRKVALLTGGATDATVSPKAPLHWLEQQQQLYERLALGNLSLFYPGAAGFPTRFTAIYHGAPLLYFTPGNHSMGLECNPLAIPSMEYLAALSLPPQDANPAPLTRRLLLIPGEEPQCPPSPTSVAYQQAPNTLALPCFG